MKELKNDELIKKIKKVLSEYTDIDSSEIKLESKLMNDLGLTSFDLFSLMASLEDEFGVTIDDSMMKELQTVEDVYGGLVKLGIQ